MTVHLVGLCSVFEFGAAAHARPRGVVVMYELNGAYDSVWNRKA